MMSKTLRGLALAGLMLLCTAALCSAAMAQRGPGGGAPPPPPPPGGNPGGPGSMGPGAPPSPGAPGMGGFERERTGASGAHSPHRVGPQLGLPGRWWDDKHTMKTLNLRSDQQKKMDGIFEAHKGALVNLFGNLQHQQAALTSLSKQDLQDENKVFAAIDHVVSARANLEKENARLLVEIRGSLDPQQVAALDKEIAAQRQ